jgi:hypothetical protein
MEPPAQPDTNPGLAQEVAKLNKQLATAAERARTLLTINNAVVLNLTQDALFQAIATALRPVIPFDRITIFLHEPGATVLRMAAAESAIPSPMFTVGLELPIEGSHAGWAFRHQRPFFRPDLAKERHYASEDQLFIEGQVLHRGAHGREGGASNAQPRSGRPMHTGEAEAELCRKQPIRWHSIENMRG